LRIVVVPMKNRSGNKEFVKNGIGKETDNPFEKVFAFTFLAGDDFICWVREKNNN